MKQLPSTATPPPSRLLRWGRWLQTVLLVTLLMLLFQQLNLLPSDDEGPVSASEQRILHAPPVGQTTSARL
jgi:hypothetical protein